MCLMTSPNHPKMAPICGTPYFDCFWYFSMHNYIKSNRTTALKVTNDRRIIFLCVRNSNLMSESNFLVLESIKRYSYWLKRQKIATTFRPKMMCNCFKWEMTNIHTLRWSSWLDNKKKKEKNKSGVITAVFFCKVALKKQNMLRFEYYVHCNVRR